MKNLKIEIFDNDVKDTTITIPLAVIKVASRLIPKKYLSSLEKSSVNIDELIAAASHPDIDGTLVEVEDHGDSQRIIISAS